MRWKAKSIAGRSYPLDHLDPFKLDVMAKVDGARCYAVRVSFGFHCFTRSSTAEDLPDLLMHHRGERRSFCFERYELSKELVAAVQYAADGRVYFSERANFLIIESVANHNAPYVAFFNVEKAHSPELDAAMFVTSAHLRPRLPDKLPAVSFATLVDYRIQGRSLKRPEPRKVIAQKRK